MGKLQAGCTLTVSEGMVVRTAATSAKAADGQEATLEFILVNHPLDCPVCDKGGECPLQDLTFRYGPGATRMTFPKLTFDKPIPISPLIALDRERCILCYRCTRFSEEVAEDGLLIARNRGARTEIATFEDEPYALGVLRQRDRALPGRRADLEPVPLRRAAVGDPERADRLHRLRGRLQRLGDDPRGEGQADPLPEPPRGRPRLALRQGPLHVPAPPCARPDHDAAPARRRRASRRCPGTRRSTRRRRCCARPGARSSPRSRARRRTRSRTALGAAPARRARRALRGAAGGDLGRARRLPAPALGDRGRGARRRRRRRPRRRARADRRALDPRGAAARRGDRHVLPDRIDSGRARRRRQRSAASSPSPATRSASGCASRSGRCSSGRAPAEGEARGSQSSRTSSASRASPAAARSIFLSPRTAAESRRPGRSPRTQTRRARSRSRCSSCRATRRPPNPDVRALAEDSERVLVITMFHELAGGWADLILPATGALERDGTSLNLEGRLQRLRRAVPPPCPDELAWISKLAARFDVDGARRTPPSSSTSSRSTSTRTSRSRTSASRADLPARHPYAGAGAGDHARACSAHGSRRTSTSSASSSCTATGRTSPGPRSSACPSSSSCAHRPKSSSHNKMRQGAASAPATPSSVRSNGTSVELRARVNRKLVTGSRVAEDQPATCTRGRGGEA